MRLVMECNEADGFHFLLVTYEHDEDEYLAQNDLLLLSKEEVTYTIPLFLFDFSRCCMTDLSFISGFVLSCIKVIVECWIQL